MCACRSEGSECDGDGWLSCDLNERHQPEWTHGQVQPQPEIQSYSGRNSIVI